MPEWIAFDDATAAAFQAHTSRPVHISAGNALDSALNAGNAVVLIPGNDRRAVLVAFRRNPPSQSAPGADGTSSTVAGGFLGLTDETVLEEEPPRGESWWRRLFR
jgi:hypothetical protein